MNTKDKAAAAKVEAAFTLLGLKMVTASFDVVTHVNKPHVRVKLTGHASEAEVFMLLNGTQPRGYGLLVHRANS